MDDKQKLEEARELLNQYAELVKTKKHEYEDTKRALDEVLSMLNKIPPFIRDRYIGNDRVKELLTQYKKETKERES